MAIEIVSFSHKTWWIFPVRYVNIYQRVDPGIAQKIMAQQYVNAMFKDVFFLGRTKNVVEVPFYSGCFSGSVPEMGMTIA